MRNPYEVLMEKQEQLDEVRKQVEALKLVVPLLGEEADKEALKQKNKWP